MPRCFLQVGQNYNAVLQNATIQQLNPPFLHQQNRFYYSEKPTNNLQPHQADATYQNNVLNGSLSPPTSLIQSAITGNSARNRQNPQPLQPSVQINIQPLIKPMQPSRTQHVQSVAPIVYSFGQTDYSNKMFPKASNFLNNNNKPAMNRRVSWGKGDTLDIEDDFADILG